MSLAARARIRDGWAAIAGIDRFPSGALTVFVDAASALGRPDWIAILAIDEAIVGAVPRADLVSPVTAELRRVGHAQATEVGALSALDFDDVLGPATLAYVDRDAFQPVTSDRVMSIDASHPGLVDLIASLTAFDDGRPVGVCGYKVWDGELAHLYAGLIPQWRARFEESRAVARRLGFEQIGGQLGLRPAASPESMSALPGRSD